MFQFEYCVAAAAILPQYYFACVALLHCFYSAAALPPYRYAVHQLGETLERLCIANVLLT